MTTFESLKVNKDETTTKKIEAVRIQRNTTFQSFINGMSSESFREFFRTNPFLFLVVIEVNKSLKKRMKQNFELENFRFICDKRSWVVQVVSTTEKSSMIFFKDARFSHIYISDGEIVNQGRPCGKNNFDNFVKHILADIFKSQNLSLLDLSLTSDQLDLLKAKSKLCQKFREGFVDPETEPAGVTLQELNMYQDEIKPSLRLSTAEIITN